MNAPVKTGEAIILSPRYLGSVRSFAAISAHRHAVIDTTMRFDKRRKEVHRCTIADTHGPVRLTVPIEKPVSMTAARWEDIVISSHGAWWHQHWTALQSAYGRTPFFEFYADDFAPFFTSGAAGQKLTEWLEGIDRLMLGLLQIDTEVTFGEVSNGDASDYRYKPVDFITDVAYYQVRQQKFGFLPDMSVADLLFNMGPEAPLVLDAMASAGAQCQDLSEHA